MAINIVVDELEGIYLLQGDGARQTKKYINFSDLENIFTSSLEINTGELPLGCKFFSRSSNGAVSIIIEKQPRKWDCRVHRRSSSRVDVINAPLPYLFFGFKYKNGRILKSLMAVSLGPITPMNQTVYRMPFGNVYDDYRICWGAQALPAINNPYNLSGLPDLFFEAAFNGDLSTGAFNIFSSDHTPPEGEDTDYYNFDFAELIKKVSVLDTFPTDRLVSNGTYDTFKRRLLQN